MREIRSAVKPVRTQWLNKYTHSEATNETRCVEKTTMFLSILIAIFLILAGCGSDTDTETENAEATVTGSGYEYRAYTYGDSGSVEYLDATGA